MEFTEKQRGSWPEQDTPIHDPDNLQEAHKGTRAHLFLALIFLHTIHEYN